jgi:hypothetical protein
LACEEENVWALACKEVKRELAVIISAIDEGLLYRDKNLIDTVAHAGAVDEVLLYREKNLINTVAQIKAVD